MKKRFGIWGVIAVAVLCLGLCGCEGADAETGQSEDMGFAETAGATETDAPEVSAAERRDHIGFGFFRMPAMDNGLTEAIEAEAEKGHVNTYLLPMAPYQLEDTLTALETVRNVGGMTWLNIGETVFIYSSPPSVIASWQEDLLNMMNTIEERGLTDAVLGFYFDEPLLWQIPKETFRDVTKALRETYPHLRTHACFAVNAISPDVWSNGNDQLLDSDTAQYLTDVSFNMYRAVDEETVKIYEKISSDLLRRVGREDVRLWYVPCVMNYGGMTTEKNAIDHLELMYDLLNTLEHPGGLLCYAYDIANRDGTLGNIGFNEMRDRDTDPWLALEERLVTIGREIMERNGTE